MSTWTASTKKNSPAGSRTEVKAGAPGRAADAVTPDRIRARAYEIFLGRRGTTERGDALSDWLQAERELRRVSDEVTKARTPR